MFDVEEFLRKVADQQIDGDEASTLFAQFSNEDKTRVLQGLENLVPAHRNGSPAVAAAGTKALHGIRTNQNCTAKQRAFVGSFVAAHAEKTKTSKRLAERYRPRLADQRTPANFNILLKEIQYPITYSHASGAYLDDVDGNRYIDIAGDFGVNLFGHAPQFLRRALEAQIGVGWALSGRYDALGRASELFCEITGQDRVAFCQSGTEALICAVRLSRAFTDKEKVALFTNSYHGHADIFLNPYMAGVSETSAQEVIALKYGSTDALNEIERYAGELAAVVVEPVQSESVDLQPVEFLKQLREVTARLGIVLVFDEMITGFRAHPRGCQGLFGIDADLATYGKILGGGLPAGAVAGRAEIMDWSDGGNWKYGDNSKPGPSTYIAGTHTQNPLKMAATVAVLEELKRCSPDLQNGLSRKTGDLVARINAYADNAGLPVECASFCSQFRFRFRLRQFTLTQALFLHLLKDRGVNYHLHGNCFLTAAHSDADIDAIFVAVRDSLETLRREEFFFDDAKAEKRAKPSDADPAEAPVSRSRSDAPQPTESKPERAKPVEAERLPPLVAIAKPGAEIATLDEQRVIEGLKDLVGRFLELSPDDFNEDDDLASLGVDSIIMTGILKAISTHFGVKLSLKKLDGAGTIGEVAHALCREIAAAEPLDQEGVSDAEVVEEEAPETPRHVEVQMSTSATNGGEGTNGGSRHQTQAAFDGRVHRRAERGSDDIAIVGMSATFPGAPNLRAFWRNLLDEKSSITEIPSNRWNWRNVYTEFGGENGTPWRWGGFVEGHDMFDPLFFRISPREAKYMDPQERLLLMHCYSALEDAGLNAGSLSGTQTGVFVGYEYTDYAERLREIRYGIPDLDPMLGDLSGRPWNLANRLSFVFNWKGPSEAINVNCAGSAVSINRGCRSLAAGETDLAVAGGACLSLLPSSYLNVAELLSPDGVTRVFGEGANGYVKGEGCGIVVLKRLDDALRENNPIYAVIRGCRQSYRGQGNSLSEVRSDSIGDLIASCYRQAGVPPETVRYMEVNGYGTRKSDAAEYDGIKSAIAGAAGSPACALGSVKGNIGNLEPVSGLAGVAKVALAMENGQMPAMIGIDQVSELIDIDAVGNPLRLMTKPMPIDDLRPRDGGRVRAGVNSFADSGVNVHILLEEPPLRQPAASPAKGRQVFVVSAKTRASHVDYVRAWIEYLGENAEVDLARLAYTVQTGREAFQHRLACVVETVPELLQKLERISAGGACEGCFTGSAAKKAKSEAAYTDPYSVAERWAGGEDVDWYALHTGALPLPLHQLPTYPFSLKRYWLDVAPRPVSPERETTPEPPPASWPAIDIAPPRQADIPAVAIKPVPLPETPDRAAKEPPRLVVTEPARHVVPSAVREPDDSAATLAVMRKLRAIVHGFLEITENDEINEYANFAEIGLTSMSIVLLIDEVNRQFGLQLPEIIAFDYPNIVELSQHIAQLAAGAPRAAAETTDIDQVLANLARNAMSVDDALALIGPAP